MQIYARITILYKTMSYSIKADLLTVKEVSAFLKLSVITIYKYIREQKIDAIQFGGHYRIEKTALVNFIKRHKIGNKVNDVVPGEKERFWTSLASAEASAKESQNDGRAK